MTYIYVLIHTCIWHLAVIYVLARVYDGSYTAYKICVVTCISVHICRVAKTHRMPQVAGHFPQKRHYSQGFCAENDQ